MRLALGWMVGVLCAELRAAEQAVVRATQAEVNAGTNNTKFVTPLTLQNKPGSGGSSTSYWSPTNGTLYPTGNTNNFVQVPRGFRAGFVASGPYATMDTDAQTNSAYIAFNLLSSLLVDAGGAWLVGSESGADSRTNTHFYLSTRVPGSGLIHTVDLWPTVTNAGSVPYEFNTMISRSGGTLFRVRNKSSNRFVVSDEGTATLQSNLVSKSVLANNSVSTNTAVVGTGAIDPTNFFQVDVPGFPKAFEVSADGNLYSGGLPVGGGGGSQTPILQDVDYANFNQTNVGSISATQITATASTPTNGVKLVLSRGDAHGGGSINAVGIYDTFSFNPLLEYDDALQTYSIAAGAITYDANASTARAIVPFRVSKLSALSTAGHANLFQLDGIWNNAAVTFNGLLIDMTNTASASGTMLVNIKSNNVPLLTLSKAGALTVVAGTRTFIHDGTQTTLTNSATLTGTEFSGGQRKDFWNGNLTVLLDKTNGAMNLSSGATFMQLTNGSLGLGVAASATPGSLDATNSGRVGPTALRSTNVFQISTPDGTVQAQIGTNGNLYVTGQAILKSGSAASPSIGFANSPTTGLYGSVAGWTIFTSSGVGVGAMSDTGLEVISTYKIGWEGGAIGGAKDVWFSRQSAGTVLVDTNLIAKGSVIGTNGVLSLRSNLVAPTAITVGASPFSWTNTLGVNVYAFLDASAATISGVSLNGQQILGGITGGATLPLQNGEYFTITYTVAPTARWKPY